MAFSKDSAAQSPLPTILSPSHAPSIPGSHVNLPLRAHKTLDSVQTITPPQEKDTPLQQAVFLNQADEARKYLKDYLAGQYLRFPDKPREYILPVSSFYQLLDDPEFESDRKQLRLEISYDARKSILTLFPMPGRRHGCIIEWLGSLAKRKLDSPVQGKVSIIRGHDWMEFQGEWEDSRREPDLGIAWIEDVGGTKLHTVVEVGVSQSRESLLNVRDLYFKGAPQVSRYVFVNIITTPEYTSPEELDIDELRIIQKADFQFDSDQGSLWYKGVQWVGKTTLFWEVWERHPESGEPKQVFKATIDPNDSETQLPFFKIPTTIAAGVEAVTVKPADIHELWYHQWKHAIIDEAVLRMKRYVRDVNRLRKHAADMAEQKDEAVKKRQEANEGRTERWKRRSEC